MSVRDRYEQVEREHGKSMGEILDGFYAQGLSDTKIAKRLNVARKTIWKWKKWAGRKFVRQVVEIGQ